MCKLNQKRKQEIELIKSIPPEDILNDLDIPYTKRPSYYECRAIWRGDKNPSLSVFKDGLYWKWKDHATGKAGSWIDLYIEIKGWDYITAVRYLRETFLFSFPQSRNNQTQKGQAKWELLTVKENPVRRPVIKNFLKEKRQIEHIPNWLLEIDYEVFNIETGEIKQFFGFGIKDKAGNYHIRNASSKITVKEVVLRMNEKEGTTYGILKKGSNKVVIVEGFIDGIRADELYPDFDILILNGIENYKKAFRELENYQELIIATDQDNAGEKVARLITDKFMFKKTIYRLEFPAKDLDVAVRENLNISLREL